VPGAADQVAVFVHVSLHILWTAAALRQRASDSSHIFGLENAYASENLRIVS
jgi:hypothetical protein